MSDKSPKCPERLHLTAGRRPKTGSLPNPYPFESIAPIRDGYVERDGVRSWYAQFGDTGPWLAFPPVYQIANTHLLKGVVPWLAQHYRVVVMDYCADCAVRFNELSPGELAERALQAMHTPVNYKPVETDGAARAASQILAVMENRSWATA